MLDDEEWYEFGSGCEVRPEPNVLILFSAGRVCEVRDGRYREEGDTLFTIFNDCAGLNIFRPGE